MKLFLLIFLASFQSIAQEKLNELFDKVKKNENITIAPQPSLVLKAEFTKDSKQNAIKFERKTLIELSNPEIKKMGPDVSGGGFAYTTRYLGVFKKSAALISNYAHFFDERFKATLVKYGVRPDTDLFLKLTNQFSFAPKEIRFKENENEASELLVVDFDSEKNSMVFLKPFFENLDQNMIRSGDDFIYISLLQNAFEILEKRGVTSAQSHRSHQFAKEVLRHIKENEFNTLE